MTHCCTPLYHVCFEQSKQPAATIACLAAWIWEQLTSTPLRKGKVITGGFQSLLRPHNANKRQSCEVAQWPF